MKTRKLLLQRACLLLLFSCLLPSSPFTLFPSNAFSQQVIDKMVASVNSGGPRPDLITYTDILWQMALQPNTPLASPRSDDLNRALQLIIDQRLILQEAEKLPTIQPTTAEVKTARDELVKQFTSESEFRQRAASVGLSSEQIDEIIRQRLSIEKYLDFRFRSFTVVTPKEVEDYYRDVYVPRLRRQQPGRIIPTLEEARTAVERTLTESKIESDTDPYLDSARARSEINIHNPV